ncbi:DUF1559 family PulG-like putative transporter [Crateriforma conspicua]|uniref:DUF1559 family PulG-like putative transporter n=1 Tax=Crateriforma conspicua TaxID=2527996 RepID=UPI00118D2270|nr:DUF1559 domain-containing protein [Crateriforma conspicua]QDV61999.1 hypothetical protein Mal65_11270 [Crateriforma conspicua]
MLKQSGSGLAVSRRTNLASFGRSAITSIELLVVFGIIALLLAILLPAVQSARDASRRLDCTNRLRQLALAVSSFQSSHTVFPSNGGAHESSRILSRDGNLVRPSTTEKRTGTVRYWGVYSDRLSPGKQTGPWSVAIFPQLGMPVQQMTDYASEISYFRCPARGARRAETPVEDDYGVYESGGHAMAKTDFAANHLSIFDRPRESRPATISAGLANTILLGEKAYDMGKQTPTSWHWDEPIYVGGSKGTARSGSKITQDGYRISYQDNWGSPHVSVANFVFFDGHADQISRSIDRGIFYELLTPSDSSVPKVGLATD